MPRRRKRDDSDARSVDTSTTRLRTLLCSPASARNEGLPLNPRDAFYYQTRRIPLDLSQSFWLRYRDLGMGPSSEAVLVPAPTRTGRGYHKHPVLTAKCKWPRRAMRHGTATVSPLRRPALLPKGVLSQWLHQEPETTRPLLQHARRRGIAFKVTSGTARQKDRKSRLLAHARGHEQPRHDNR